MITAAKESIDVTKNMVDISLKSNKTNLSSKTNSKSFKVDYDKSNSEPETSKSEDFKQVLSLKINSQDADTKKVDEVTENSAQTIDNKVDELKQKLKELESDSESVSKDNVSDILTELLNLLNKLGVNEEDLKSNVEINSDMLQTMIGKINKNEFSKSDLSNVMAKVIEALKTDSTKNGLNTDSLKSIGKFLNTLSARLVNDNTEVTKDIKNLMSEVSNMLDNKQSQSETVLTSQNLLNTNYAKDNQEISTKNESNDILTELMNLTSQLGIKEEIKPNGEVNSEILKTMIQEINGDVTSNKNLSSVMGKVMQLLKADPVKDGLDTDSLKLIEKLSSDLSISITDNSTKVTEDIKSDIKDLMSEVANVSDNNQNQSEKIVIDFMNLINKVDTNQDKLNLNGEINSDIFKTIVDEINGNESSKSNLSSVVGKVIELLKTDFVKNALDTNSLKSIEKILNNISANLVDDNTIATKDTKSVIKNLMLEISNMLDNTQSQSKKVLTLEDMLNKSYSQDNNESSAENETNNAKTLKDSKEVSKEDKFLNSLIDDDKDSSLNKINLFASRTQVIQNQGVDNVRGLTINKATLANDLISDVKYMSNNGLKELTVKINPGNLGEITIRLIEEDGVMKANLKASSKETTALLSQNLADIKKQLGEQNIKIADVNIELYQDDTTFFKEQGFGGQLAGEQGRSNNKNSNTVNNATITEEELIENIASNDSNIDIRA